MDARAAANTPGPGAPNALLLGVCGWIGILGAIASIAANVAGTIMVPNHDWIADTISDLAAGRYENIQDVGLYSYAASLIACAIGAANAHPGTNRWTLGIVALAVMAALVVVIGARNEYGDGDWPATWGIHMGLVFALSFAFLLTSVVMARGLGRFGAGYRRLSQVVAVLFAVSAPAFFLAPTGYDGLIERVVGVITIVWVCAFAWMLLERQRALAG